MKKISPVPTTRTVTAFLLGPLLAGFLGGYLVASTGSSVAEEPAPVRAGQPVFTSGVHLVNEEGDVRASFSLWDGEHPALIMGDAQCERRAFFAVYDKERTGFTLYGDDCKRRAALEVDIHDQPTLVLRDQRDTPRFQVLLNPDGSPLVRLFDLNGKILWEKP